MLQLCECPPEQFTARRLSAQEFCALAQTEAGSLYRPRSEVLRMLTVGQAFGVCAALDRPDAALLVLPAEANLALAAALREWIGLPRQRTYILTPPINSDPATVRQLLAAAKRYLHRLAPGCPVWAVLERTPEAEPLVPLYLQQGFALRALRPLTGLSPWYLFTADGPDPADQGVWVELADATHLALLLCRGWAAVASRPTPAGCALQLVPT